MKHHNQLMPKHQIRKLFNFRNLIWLMLLGVLTFLLPIASALETLSYQSNENIDIKVPCLINKSNCPSGAECNLTMISPNSEVFVDNQAMQYNSAYFNYSLGTVKDTGDYQSTMICKYNSLSGYTSFIVRIQGLSANRCPTDYNMLWFIGALCGFFLLISLIFKWSFLGILTSLGVMFLGFTMVGCSGVFGSILIAFGLIMFIGFVFMKWV
jgi:hypothetical protein